MTTSVRVVVQRVQHARVEVSQHEVGSIGRGLLVYLGAGQGDSARDCDWIVRKVSNLRIFPGDDGKMDKSVIQLGLELLIVSQFTLYADTKKGNRPSFAPAAAPAEAQRLYEEAISGFRKQGLRVATGQFRASMLVHSCNDGPINILMDSQEG